MYSLFLNAITVLYCDICDNCAALLKNLRGNVELIPYGKFNSTIKLRIYRQCAEVAKIARKVQKVFSLISALLCFAYVLIFFMALSLLFIPWKDIESTFGIDVLFFNCNAQIHLVILMVAASEVPREMEQRCDIIEDKEAKIGRHYHELDSCYLAAMLNHVPDVTLSAGDVLFFTRHSILAVIGSIHTYVLLIYNLF